VVSSSITVVAIGWNDDDVEMDWKQERWALKDYELAKFGIM